MITCPHPVRVDHYSQYSTINSNAETCTDHSDLANQPHGNLELVQIMQISENVTCDLDSDLLYPTRVTLGRTIIYTTGIYIRSIYRSIFLRLTYTVISSVNAPPHENA
ncbi:unnamed protein product, partial [Laminaria digitata]